MKNLITGGAGFIGSCLVDHMLSTQDNSEIFTVDINDLKRPNTTHFVSNLHCDEESRHIIEQINPDCIYHLAGISRVTDKIDFLQYFSTNFLTTVSLIRGAEKLKKPITFFFTTISLTNGPKFTAQYEDHCFVIVKANINFDFTSNLKQLNIFKKNQKSQSINFFLL